MPLFKKPACDWMLVGLGNPGAQYARTRHNMGFLALDLLEKQLGADKEKQRHQALCASAVWHGQKLLLVRPQTFMNASGLAVQQAASYYKLPPERIVVLFDDISLPVGKIRVRPSGSAGGHNGLKNIIQHLGTDQFPRIRVGVGQKPHPDYDLADWVLGKFVGEDKKTMDAAIKRAADAVECLLADGPDTAMNRFNG